MFLESYSVQQTSEAEAQSKNEASNRGTSILTNEETLLTPSDPLLSTPQYSLRASARCSAVLCMRRTLFPIRTNPSVWTLFGREATSTNCFVRSSVQYDAVSSLSAPFAPRSTRVRYSQVTPTNTRHNTIYFSPTEPLLIRYGFLTFWPCKVLPTPPSIM